MGTKVLTAVSFSLAVAASIAWLVVPAYSPGGATLLEVNGPWVLLLLAFPVLIALLPLVFPKQAIRIIAAIILGGFAFLGGFSIGLFYFPSVVTMGLAGIEEDRP